MTEGSGESRVVFLGTPESAVPTLREIAEQYDVALVVTRPDKPKGRSGSPAPPPVKVAAEDLGLPVSQPSSHEERLHDLREAAPLAVGVVVAYGAILKPEVLATASLGFLNVHFSLLPRWRGAAPVARALMAGDTMTGVTIIQLDEGLDTGPVLTAQAVDIRSNENAGELTERLSRLGARLLRSSIDPYVSGSLVPVAQVDRGLTYADKITAADRVLDPGMTVAEFVGRVRGLAPSPGATLPVDDEMLKVLETQPAEGGPEPGSWIARNGHPVVGLTDGGVLLVSVQPPGKRPMAGDAWMRGRHKEEGRVG